MSPKLAQLAAKLCVCVSGPSGQPRSNEWAPSEPKAARLEGRKKQKGAQTKIPKFADQTRGGRIYAKTFQEFRARSFLSHFSKVEKVDFLLLLCPIQFRKLVPLRILWSGKILSIALFVGGQLFIWTGWKGGD